MPQLKKSEKRLLIVFIGLIVVLVNISVIESMFAYNNKLEQRKSSYELKLKKADLWMKQKDYWLTRRAWISEHKPEFESSMDATSRLWQFVENRANDNQLMIMSKTLRKSEQQTAYHEISVDLKATGSMEAICKWANDVSDPASFYVFKELTLKQTKEPNKLEVSAIIAQWCDVKDVIAVSEN
ncbi:MAG: hypothetical protein AAF984_03975 [Verrucomicrobiota bacterium]